MNEQPQADDVQMFREALTEVAKVFIGQQEAVNYLCYQLLVWHFLELESPMREAERFREYALRDIGHWLDGQPFRDDALMTAERILGLFVEGVAQGVGQGHTKPMKRTSQGSALSPRDLVVVLMARTRASVWKGKE